MTNNLNKKDVSFVPKHDRYEIIAHGKKEKIFYYEESGDYSGDFFLITQDDKNVYVYVDCYGSCSVCDNYESQLGFKEKITVKEAEEFASEYSPLIIFTKIEFKKLTEKKIYSKLIGVLGNKLSYLNLDVSLIFKKIIELKIRDESFYSTSI